MLSISIMTCPSRLEHARRLAHQLDEETTIAVDPRPEDPPQTLRTARVAWAAAHPDATHHLVLQDDAVVPPDFLKLARGAVDAMPTAAVAFHADWASRNGAAVRAGAALGARWVSAVQDHVPTIGLALPAHVARDFVAYVDAWPDPDTPDDVLMAFFSRDTGLPVMLTVPNLVGHADVPSVIGNQAKGRREAACYVGSPGDDWSPDPARTMDGYGWLPFFKRGKPYLYVTSPLARNRWSAFSVEDGLSRIGLDATRLRAQFKDDIRRDPPDLGLLGEQLSHMELCGIWVTAYLIAFGRRHAEPLRTRWSAWGRPQEERLLTRSLWTIAVGGLFPVVPHEDAIDGGDRLAAVAERGFNAGDAAL